MKERMHITPKILLFLAWSFNPAMAGNESCIAFNQTDTGGGESGESRLFKPQATEAFGWLIAVGGTYFLKSSSDIDLILSLVESSESTRTYFEALKRAINQVIINTEQARTIYYQSKETAGVTPYDQSIISNLIEVDYSKFQQQKGLIQGIFYEVVFFLCPGDVRGIYQEFYKNAGLHLEKIVFIKKTLDENVSPNLETLWRINPMFSEAKMFSHYMLFLIRYSDVRK